MLPGIVLKAFDPYVAELDRLVTTAEGAVDARVALVHLDGEAGRRLREVIPLDDLRRHGAFFTGEHLAKRLLALVPDEPTTHYLDPACGCGDLLLAASARLPLKRTLEATLREWNQRLSGRDLVPSFTRAARARITLAAILRGARPAETGQNPADLLTNIAPGDGLTLRPGPNTAVLVNPPYGRVAAPAGCSWSSGATTAAALFLDRLLDISPSGTRVAAVLPEVLRGGARYDRFRAVVERRCDIRAIQPAGVFDALTDVDVFLLGGIRSSTAGPEEPKHLVPWVPPTSEYRLEDLCTVSVGAVVANRDPHRGPWRRYLDARSRGRDRQIEPGRRRRFTGAVVIPPFVVVPRTSRAEERERAGLRATIVRSDGPVAVENHLLVLVPDDHTVRGCRELVALVESECAATFLNERLRCRHLTVRAVRDIPRCLHLRFAPDVLRRLGEELNPSPEQGILELVRNAYDADAAKCTVKLTSVSSRGGTLTISDNGDGMDRGGLRDAWLVLGRSSKDAHARTNRFNRLPVGSKGLGRLAALRLGAVAEIRTRPASKPGTEYRVVFDWSRFDDVATVDQVPLTIDQHSTTRRSGTTILVRELHRRFTKTEVRRLARAMVLLATPFETQGSFKPRLDAPEFRELERLVRQGYWDQAAYQISAGLDADGRAWATMTDHERGERVAEASHADIRRGKDRGAYAAPEATFELSVFRLSGDGGTRGRTSGVSLGALKEWIAVVGGVHLYHRGLRVYPYGDPGHDWLDMNLRRVASPEERPSTNNSIGRVQVFDERAVLQQKTDRTGFIETLEFDDLRQFAQDVLDWAAKYRLDEAEKRRRAERVRAEASLESAQTRMRKAIASAPPETRAELQRANRDVRRATTRKVTTLTTDLELYRTLATIGTTTAVMAHESFNPPNTIVKLARSVRRRAKPLLGSDYSKIEEQVDLIESNARRLATLVELPRRLLDRSKRRRGTFSANDVIADTLKLLGPLLDEHKVRVEHEFDVDAPSYIGTVAAFESVVTNLIINAVSALDGSTGRDRLIRVETSSDDGVIVLDVADNGPGIRNINIKDIWLPGRGTTNRGVGLGLTIVRDIVADLDGNATAVAHGELGGAQFTIEIPKA